MAKDTDEARANRLASMTRPSGPAVAAEPGRGALVGRSRLKGAATLERSRIVPDPDQPRTEFDPEDLQLLASSLRERGQLQPIRVRWDEGQGAYVILLGERRWRAAGLAGLESLDVIIAEDAATPEDRLEDQLVENCLRSDLRPMEQAQAYRRLIDSRGISLRALAERLHVSAATISKALALLELPEEVQVDVDAGAIATDLAYQLSRVEDPQEQAQLAELAKAGQVRRADVEKAVKARQPAAPRTGRPAAEPKPQPVTVDLGDAVVLIRWRRPGAGAAQVLRRALKAQAEVERQAEVDAA